MILSLNPDQCILSAVSARGTAHPRDIPPIEGLSASATRHRMLQLVDAGELMSLGRGAYRVPGPAFDGTAQRVFQIISRAGANAHISGFHVLARFAPQVPISGLPILLLVDPADQDLVQLELARHALVSLPRAQAPAVRAPDRRSELVLIERQTAAVQARLGAISHIAPTEKAWVDLFRLIIDAEYPMSPFEAGRMLGAGIRAGVIDRRRIRRVARHYPGIFRLIAPTLDASTPPTTSPVTAALRAGLDAET